MKAKLIFNIVTDALGCVVGLAAAILIGICLWNISNHPEWSKTSTDLRVPFGLSIVCLVGNAIVLRNNLRAYERKFGRRYKLQTTR